MRSARARPRAWISGRAPALRAGEVAVHGEAAVGEDCFFASKPSLDSLELYAVRLRLPRCEPASCVVPRWSRRRAGRRGACRSTRRWVIAAGRVDGDFGLVEVEGFAVAVVLLDAAQYVGALRAAAEPVEALARTASRMCWSVGKRFRGPDRARTMALADGICSPSSLTSDIISRLLFGTGYTGEGAPNEVAFDHAQGRGGLAGGEAGRRGERAGCAGRWGGPRRRPSGRAGPARGGAWHRTRAGGRGFCGTAGPCDAGR